MVAKYVDANDFNDFKNDFKTMVGVFNHSVSAIRDDSKSTKKHVQKMGDEFNSLRIDMAIVKEKTKNNNWMIKWIFGIVAVVVAGGILGSMLGG